MKIVKLIPIIALAIALGSCIDDDSNTVDLECSWGVGADVSNVTYVTDPDGTSHIYDATQVYFTYHIDRANAEIAFTDMTLGPFKKVSFATPTSPYTTTEYAGWETRIGQAFTAYNVTVSSLTAGTVVRNYGHTMRNAYWADMIVDGYRVSLIQTENSYYGRTDVTTIGTPNVYTTTETSYSMKLDVAAMTADIVIENAKFAANMPMQTRITIPDVPVTISHNGLHFEADEVIPLQANGAPKPEFMITNIDGDAGQGTGLTLKFDVAGAFHVDVACGYTAMVN